uniref:Putative secreted protein n=1 Tax=Amblyomma parvum TaxID=251391 RepID=A0A023G2H9_AMBPA
MEATSCVVFCCLNLASTCTPPVRSIQPKGLGCEACSMARYASSAIVICRKMDGLASSVLSSCGLLDMLGSRVKQLRSKPLGPYTYDGDCTSFQHL